MVEGVEMVLGDGVAGEVDEGEAVLCLCALLAQVLALGRREGGEEIVKALVTVIHPAELLVGARQEAGIAEGLGVIGIDEIDVQRGELVLLGELDGAGEEGRLELGFVGAFGHEAAATGDRREGHGRQQFRVVGSTRAFIGVGPALVEHELAARVHLGIERHGGAQAAIVAADQEVARDPAGVRRRRAGAFHGFEEVP